LAAANREAVLRAFSVSLFDGTKRERVWSMNIQTDDKTQKDK